MAVLGTTDKIQGSVTDKPQERVIINSCAGPTLCSSSQLPANAPKRVLSQSSDPLPSQPDMSGMSKSTSGMSRPMSDVELELPKNGMRMTKNDVPQHHLSSQEEAVKLTTDTEASIHSLCEIWQQLSTSDAASWSKACLLYTSDAADE